MSFPTWGIAVIITLLEVVLRYLKNGVPETPIHVADHVTTQIRKATNGASAKKPKAKKTAEPS